MQDGSCTECYENYTLQDGACSPNNQWDNWNNDHINIYIWIYGFMNIFVIFYSLFISKINFN